MNWNYEKDALKFLQKFPDQPVPYMRKLFFSHYSFNFFKLGLFCCLPIIDCWTEEQSGIMSNERSCCCLLNLWLDCILNLWSLFLVKLLITNCCFLKICSMSDTPLHKLSLHWIVSLIQNLWGFSKWTLTLCCK